ncbi:MAG: hypothetical protein AAB353_10990 [Candidatus Hydrogenedentota bacterium]
MRRGRGVLFLACLLTPLVCGALLGDCGLRKDDFVKVSKNGFDAADNAEDFNDYPWSMTFYTPDGETEGHVYVGTGNNFAGIGDYVYQNGANLDGIPFRPAEIRRHRPDLGERDWERVYDTREEGGPFQTSGFRSLRPYRAESDGELYLYAGSFGADASLYRSPTGDPGTWERVFQTDKPGAIRGLEEHNGLLYFSTTVLDLIDEDFETPEGKIYATDGETFWPVIEDGFGNPNNLESIVLRSFDGWLYAGTRNKVDGFEIWKFAGPAEGDEAPVPIVLQGGADARNESAGTALVFHDRLYFGTLIFGGLINLIERGVKGADLLRIAPDDTWENVVGKDGISGMGPGFDDPRNAYLWSLAEFDGWLYAGTWDDSVIAVGALVNLPLIPGLISGEINPTDARDVPPGFLAFAGSLGGDLYKSKDGVHWTNVFNRGLGNHNNYGIRTMDSASGRLYLGFANPYDGLEIWRSK